MKKNSNKPSQYVTNATVCFIFLSDNFSNIDGSDNSLWNIVLRFEDSLMFSTFLLEEHRSSKVVLYKNQLKLDLYKCEIVSPIRVLLF